MKLNNFAIIFAGIGLDPKIHRAVIQTPTLTYLTIGVDLQHKEQVIDVAKEAVENGAQIVELCGGFGPIWVAKVIEALEGKVPVGGVYYGPEARQQLVNLGLVYPA